MVYSYYPGCTLKSKATELDRYARASASALGFELEEIENWQCCGAVYPMAKDEIATKLSSVRALADAKAHVMIPIVQQRIEICEKLTGEYAEELYKDILAGK